MRSVPGAEQTGADRPGHEPPNDRPTDSGAAIVWALALVTFLLLTGYVVPAVAAAAVVRQRVATVADIAAVIAAQSDGDPCGQAATTVQANGMQLASCTLDGLDVVVGVVAPAPEVVARLLSMLGRPAAPVTASARAGPPAS